MPLYAIEFSAGGRSRVITSHCPDTILSMAYSITGRHRWLAHSGLPIRSSHLAAGAVAHCELRYRLRGGKGAFGQMLKEEGEKMSKKKTRKNKYRTLKGTSVELAETAKALARRQSKDSRSRPKRSPKAIDARKIPEPSSVKAMPPADPPKPRYKFGLSKS